MKRSKTRPHQPPANGGKEQTSEPECQLAAGRKFMEKYRETFKALAVSR
jgi:hypothetical protein